MVWPSPQPKAATTCWHAASERAAVNVCIVDHQQDSIAAWRFRCATIEWLPGLPSVSAMVAQHRLDRRRSQWRCCSAGAKASASTHAAPMKRQLDTVDTLFQVYITEAVAQKGSQPTHGAFLPPS